MTAPDKFRNHFAPVKYFLSSYRALSDGRSGIRQLEQRIEQTTVLLSEWKIGWIGTCTVLRSAIDLFRVDQRSCLAPRIREEISNEWNLISKNRSEHSIFWDFLRHERDNVIHQYEWRAYETWVKPDGTFRAPRLSLLIIEDDGARPMLLMRDGPFKGRDSLDLLRESADWVEARIFAAVRRAGFDPDENRNLFDFLPLPPTPKGLLSGPAEG